MKQNLQLFQLKKGFRFIKLILAFHAYLSVSPFAISKNGILCDLVPPRVIINIFFPPSSLDR